MARKHGDTETAFVQQNCTRVPADWVDQNIILQEQFCNRPWFHVKQEQLRFFQRVVKLKCCTGSLEKVAEFVNILQKNIKFHEHRNPVYNHRRSVPIHDCCCLWFGVGLGHHRINKHHLHLERGYYTTTALYLVLKCVISFSAPQPSKVAYLQIWTSCRSVMF